MGDVSKPEFLGQCHAYADSIEQDMAMIAGSLDSGLVTQAEHDQVMARLQRDHEEITAIIERNRAEL